MKANRYLSFVTFLIPTLLLASAALPEPTTEWRTDSENTGQETQGQIDAAIHADGSWTAAWIDHRYGYPAVFARSYDASDDPLGPGVWLTNGLGLFGVDLNARSVTNPVVASIGANGSLVAWLEERGGTDRVLAALLSTEGQMTGPVVVNLEERINSRSELAMARSGDRVLLVWTEGEDFSEIWGRVVTTDLALIGTDFPLHEEGGSAQQSPRATAAPEGWIAVWRETAVTNDDVVLLQAIAADGSLQGGPVSVATTEGQDQREPAIVGTANGYYLSWTSSSVGSIHLHGRSFDTNLQPLADPFLVVDEDETVTPRRPEVAAIDQNSVLSLWTAGEASRSRFYARVISLPDDPTGTFTVLDDPEPPEGEILVPSGLSICGGSGQPMRIFWWDERDGWDLVYRMRLDAAGQPAENPTQLEIDDGTASQILPCIALAPNGNGMATWCDFRTGGLTIYGVRLGAGAEPIGGSFRISESTGGSVSIPSTNLRDLLRNRSSVIALADGRAVAAWTTILPAGESLVYLQNFDVDGERLGDNYGLPVFQGVNGQASPDLAALPDSSYFVVWRDTSGGTNGNILAHRFLSDGTAIGDTTSVIDHRNEGAAQEKPVIASSGTGEMVVAWIDDRRGDFDVYIQRLGPTGQKIQRNILVSGEEESPVPQSNPDVAASPDRYVVVWDNNALSQGSAVVGLLVTLPSAKSPDAREEQIPFAIATGSAGFKYPRVAMAADGRFVVTYWDTSSDSVRVIAQRYTRNALLFGPAYSVTSLGGDVAAIPGNVAVTADSILYAWSDSRDATGWDARVRKVSWDYGGVVVAVETTQWAVTEVDRSLVLTWSVPRSRAGSSYRIWRQIGGQPAGATPGPAAERIGPAAIGPIEPAGIDYRFVDEEVLGGRTATYWIEDEQGEFAGPWSGSLSQARTSITLRALDNPFFDRTRLRWTATPGLPVSLAIYDLSGRRLISLGPVQASEGSGEWIWDGRDSEGHSVAAGLYWARMQAASSGSRSVRLVRLR